MLNQLRELLKMNNIMQFCLLIVFFLLFTIFKNSDNLRSVNLCSDNPRSVNLRSVFHINMLSPLSELVSVNKLSYKNIYYKLYIYFFIYKINAFITYKNKFSIEILFFLLNFFFFLSTGTSSVLFLGLFDFLSTGTSSVLCSGLFDFC